MNQAGAKNDGKPVLVSVAYEAIYKKIVTLEFKPGQPLQEKVLCGQLKIGRTPIREALFLLSNEHLVEFKPQSGFIVKPITFQGVKSMFKAMRLFELGAAQFMVNEDFSDYLVQMSQSNATVEKAIVAKDVYALVQANHEFHMAFVRCSHNEFLIKAMHEVRCEANRMAYLSFNQEFETTVSNVDHYSSVIRHHNELIAAAEQRDLPRMEIIIGDHITNFQNRIVNYLIA